MDTNAICEWLERYASDIGDTSRKGYDGGAAFVVREAIADLRRLSELAQKRTQGGTVRVRIAVAITPDGKWFAIGDEKMGQWRWPASATGDGGASYWITADLPVPKPVEINGRVE